MLGRDHCGGPEESPRLRSRAETREAEMAGVVLAAVVGVFVFIGAVIALVAIGIRREERGFTLTGHAPGPFAGVVRKVNGVGLRDLDARLAGAGRQLVRQ